MRGCHVFYSCLAVVTLAASPLCAQAPQPQPSQQAQPVPAVAPPKAYTPVPVAAPQPLNDAGFIALRKQMASVAEKRDRAGLQKLIVQKGFFWEGESGDKADKKKSNFDNFAAAIHLDDADGTGWEILAGAAQEPTAEPDEDRKGVVCGPASPKIDEQQFVALVKDTGTDADEWGFPNKDGIEVRATAKDDSAVVEKLGMNLVRVFPDDTNNTTEPITNVRVVLPSGKLGYVPVAAVLPIVSDQVCYSKDAGGWKITGYAGGQ
jgi:hypothetical protein